MEEANAIIENNRQIWEKQQLDPNYKPTVYDRLRGTGDALWEAGKVGLQMAAPTGILGGVAGVRRAKGKKNAILNSRFGLVERELRGKDDAKMSHEQAVDVISKALIGLDEARRNGDDAAVEAVNLDAPMKLTMLMAGRESGRGAVVNILDAAVLPTSPADGRPSREPAASSASPRYAATKRALLDYTIKSAAMFADSLRVNAVAPGPVFAPVGVREKAGETPIGRPKAEDVAKAVEFLLEADATTGAVIPVDGGEHLA